MLKFLESKFFAPVMAVVVYAITMLVLLQGILSDVIKLPTASAKEKEPEITTLFPEEKEIPETVYEPAYLEKNHNGKSWEFENPDMSTLVTELKKEKEKLSTRSVILEQLEDQILEEMKNLKSLRNEIEVLKNEFNANLFDYTDVQVKQLKNTAEIIRELDRDKAVSLIMVMHPAEATRLMGFFRTDETADLLEHMSGKGQSGLQLAAKISSGLRRVYLPPMEIEVEQPLDLDLDIAESSRLAGLADFYTSMGPDDAWEILKDSGDENLVKVLMHTVPSFQKSILSRMIGEGTIGERRATKVAKALHDTNHNQVIQSTIEEAMFTISAKESKKLQKEMDVLALMTDEDLLEYLSEEFSLLEVAKLFKHLDETRQEQLVLKVIEEESFGPRRGKELADLINRMELGNTTTTSQEPIIKVEAIPEDNTLN